MKKNYWHHRLNQGLLRMSAALLLTVFVLAMSSPARAMPIDDTHKWAWGTNGGWVNHKAAHGQATVYNEHLEGYAWAENAGWVGLGTYSGGEAHTYLNTAANNYGVNNDGSGNLSGFGWSATVGWINFRPTHGGVTIDPATGDFSGHAWSENAGWIRFAGTAQDTTAYKVKTDATTYTVTYNGNGNTGGAPPVDGNPYQQGATVTVLGSGTLEKTGSAFAAWNTAADGGGTQYEPGAQFAMPGANVTLYAQWTLGSEPIPTLSEWGMIILITLLAGITLRRLRRETV